MAGLIVRGQFFAGDAADITGFVSVNGQILKSFSTNPSPTFTYKLDLNAGGFVDFAVGNGYLSGSTGLAFTIEMQTIPTASPSPSATANLSCSEATGATRSVRRSASTSNTHTVSRPNTSASQTQAPSATVKRQKTSSPSVIVTRSVSASGTLVPLAPYRTLPQPVFGAAAGTAVAATSHSVAALAAIASPSGTAQVGKMQSALRLFLCNPPQDDPIPLYVFPIQAAFGDSRMPQVAGTVVLSSALYAAVPALCWIVLWWQSPHRAGEAEASPWAARISYSSTVFATFQSYFVPSIVLFATTLLLFGDSWVIAACCLCCALMPLCFVALQVSFCVPEHVEQVEEGLRSTNSWHAEALAPFIDSCRGLHSFAYRIAAVEELSCGVVIGVIAAFESGDTCGTLSWVTSAVTLLHLVYIVAWRPYQSRSTLLWSIVNALLLLVVGMGAALTDMGAPFAVVEEIVSVAMQLQSFVFFGQAITAAVEACRERQRKKCDDASPGTDLSVLTVPLHSALSSSNMQQVEGSANPLSILAASTV